MRRDFLSKDEILIYTRVKEYLKKKPFFSVVEISHYLNYQLKGKSDFNIIKIEKIIKNLVSKNIIIAGSKLSKENILEVPKRKMIYDYIKSNPGSNINELMKNLKLGSNHVSWHLKFLEKFQFIRSKYFDNRKAFFESKIMPDYDKFYFYLRNNRINKIIGILKEKNEFLRPKLISKLLNMHYYTLRKYLNVLRELNLINTSTDKSSFNLNHKLYHEVIKKLNITSDLK